MTKYNMNFDNCFPFSDETAQIALAATTISTFTVPGPENNQYRCEFSIPQDANIWVGYNITPTVPSAHTVNSANRVERINNYKYIRYVRGGDILSFISDSIVTNMGLSLLQLPSPK